MSGQSKLTSDLSGHQITSVNHDEQTLDIRELEQSLANKAGLNSPVFTGNPTAPTAVPGSQDYQIATTQFVTLALAALIDSSPTALNTLNELAAALGDDPNFATTVTNSLASKLNSSAISAFGLTLVDDVDAASARATLEAAKSGVASGSGITINTGKLLGRTSAGSGALEELPIAGIQQIWIPATSMSLHATVPPASNKITLTNGVIIDTLDFDATTSEAASFAIKLPKSWDQSSITAQFVWSHASTTVDFGTTWGIRASSSNDAVNLDTAYGADVLVSDTGGSTSYLYVSPVTANINIGGTISQGAYLTFLIGRSPADASDTLAIDARLHGVLLNVNFNALNDN